MKSSKHSLSPIFFRTVVLSFVILTVGIVGVGRALNKRKGYLLHETQPNVSRAALTAFPKQYVVAEVLSSQTAKRRKLFWVPFSVGSIEWGFAVDVLNHPKLFQSFFPGYPDSMRNDRKLWSAYFSRDFDGTFFTPEIPNTFETSLRPYLASFGCVDIYRKYGADVVIFGSSQAGHTIVPSLFQKNRGDNASVLLCARHQLGPAGISKIIPLMEPAPKKSRLSILVYSPFWANRRSQKFLEAQAAGIDSTVSRYRASLITSSWIDFKPSAYFGTHPWRDVVGWNFQELRNLKPIGEEAKRKQFEDRSLAIVLDKKDVEGLPRLEALFPKAVAQMETIYCDVTAAKKELANLVGQLLRISDRVFIYVSPDPVMERNITEKSCSADAIRSVVESVKSTKVGVSSTGFSEYGLTLRHVVTPVDDKAYVFDQGHMNYEGGKLVTHALSKKIAEFESSGRP